MTVLIALASFTCAADSAAEIRHIIDTVETGAYRLYDADKPERTATSETVD